MSTDAIDEMGPIDFVLIEWPGRQPSGEAAPILVDGLVISDHDWTATVDGREAERIGLANRIVPKGQARAAAEGMQIEFREADAENLPFDDNSFDTVLSTFGVMFTPNQDRAAAELMRVCKPKGQIGLANWTPEGFIGQLFKTLGKYLPPPTGTKSPALWGTSARLTEMFDADARSIKAESRLFKFRYRSPAHFLDVFKTYYGPVLKTFAALPEQAQSSLRADLLALAETFNRSGDASLVVPSEYLEIVITKR